MNFEAGKLKEEENKKNKLSEKEISEQTKKTVEHKKAKEKIEAQIQTDEKLFSLKELIDKWVISKEAAEKVISWENIENTQIEEIFDKIDEIEDIKDIDKYLPEDLRITKDEYQKAVENPIFRIQTITKLSTALTVLAEQINPDSAMGLNLFSWFLAVLDKNLISIQENTIDIKDSLVEIEEKENPKPKLSFWQRFINFLKEIFKG